MISFSGDKCIHPDCECLDYCEAADPTEGKARWAFEKAMRQIGRVLRDGVELLDADLDDMKACYNAGMERAAEIAESHKETSPVFPGDGSVYMWKECIAKAIRKEIT